MLRRFNPLSRIVLLIALLTSAFLIGCGKSAPEPVGTAPPFPSQTATVIASPAVPQTTIGQLADRIAIAWTAVRTYRAVTTSWVATAASPVAATPSGIPPTSVTIDEVILPGTRHVIQTEQGSTEYELIVVEGVIYARGSGVPGLATPVPIAVWTKLDPSSAVSPMFAEEFQSLLAPIAPPYSGLSTAERDRVAWELGIVNVDGRDCRRYRVSDTTMTGERIDVFVSIGADDLPCSIETVVASSRTITVFTYNPPLTIVAPI